MFLTPGSRARQQSFTSLLLRRFTKSQPHAPSDGLELFARRRAGRSLTAQIGPTGFPFDLQPYLGGQKIGYSTASGVGVTTTTSLGIAAPTVNGTATARALGTTSLLSGTRRVGHVLASAANNLVTGWYLNGNNTIVWRGNAAGRGGFFFHARFGFVALTAGNRHLIGISTSTITSDPSAGSNLCCIAQDAADTTFQVMFAGAGATTKVNTGLTPTTDRIYDVFIYQPPAADSIKFTLLRYDDTGIVDQSFEYEATTSLPSSTSVSMTPRVCSGSGSATTGAQIDILQAYIESDF